MKPELLTDIVLIFHFMWIIFMISVFVWTMVSLCSITFDFWKLYLGTRLFEPVVSKNVSPCRYRLCGIIVRNGQVLPFDTSGNQAA